MISWAAILSSTKPGPLVRVAAEVAVADLAAEAAVAGVAVMAVGAAVAVVVAGVAEGAVVAEAGTAVIAEAVVAATGAGKRLQQKPPI